MSVGPGPGRLDDVEFQAAVSRLKAGSRTGGILSVAGALIALAAIGVSSWQVYELQGRKDRLFKDIAELQSQIAYLQTQRAKLLVRDAEQQDAIGSAQFKIATGEVATASKILARAATINDAAPVRRVFFQARGKDQASLYERCANTLIRRGYRVPKLEIVASSGPKASTVRFFHRQDADEANQVAEDVGDCAGRQFRVTQIRGYENSPNVKPHQFEVWFSQDLPAYTPGDLDALADQHTREIENDHPGAQVTIVGYYDGRRPMFSVGIVDGSGSHNFAIDAQADNKVWERATRNIRGSPAAVSSEPPPAP